MESSLLRFTCHTLTTRNETIRLASLLLVQSDSQYQALSCCSGACARIRKSSILEYGSTTFLEDHHDDVS
ncbi:hypothetical protein SDJN03_18626, partial [Cucurbita argyrosperma subsp. sororia]